MTSGITVRRASVADAGQIAAAHVLSWREAYTTLLPADMLAASTIPSRVGAWTRTLREPSDAARTAVYVADDRNLIVGFVACGAQRSPELIEHGFSGEVSAIYVLEAWHRRRLGRRLMEAAAVDLLDRGFDGLSLWVIRDNQRARSFYERLGGVRIAQRVEARRSGPLVEVAYGWTNLAALALGDDRRP